MESTMARLWLLVAPWTLKYSSHPWVSYWNDMLIGAVLAGVSWWGLWLCNRIDPKKPLWRHRQQREKGEREL